ncbi:hypothetical protein MVEN_02245800 [Mycena venus]|uniref:Uncharacterized protein n=1 Tax=Mycena venus TaxID=2733690 RepID=A0A8H7CET2_9AGAR|nr:hypothetical protein MVEN_02245800 [Mycena venus]
MSATNRTIANRQMLSALNPRVAGPFSDATNTIQTFGATEKVISRREARQRTKKLRRIHNATHSPVPKEPAAEIVVNAHRSATPAVEANIHASHIRAPIPPACVPAFIFSTHPRPRPTLIIRTLPGPRPKKYYGPFEACSREDVLVEETRTWEEDTWGVIYFSSTPDLAATIVGPVRVITLQATEVGAPGGAQIFYE